MVNITDTRTQKVVGYTSAHITETVFANDVVETVTSETETSKNGSRDRDQVSRLHHWCLHMTNIGRSKALYPHHSCIIIRKSTENG